MSKQQYDFKVTKSLVRSTSHGVVNSEDSVELDVTVGIHDGGESGWFEFYDEESGGEDWYAEGCLEFDGKELVGYDGVFELSDFIIAKLVELGYTDNL
jgi:hypothetical protein